MCITQLKDFCFVLPMCQSSNKNPQTCYPNFVQASCKLVVREKIGNLSQERKLNVSQIREAEKLSCTGMYGLRGKNMFSYQTVVTKGTLHWA